MDYYEDIREFIIKGGIHKQIYLPEVNFLVRLRNPSSEALGWMFEYSPSVSQKRDCALLASSIVSVNGTPLRQEDWSDLASHFYKKMPAISVRHLFYSVVSLLGRAKRAHEYLEPFCYEDESRSLWRRWNADRSFGYSPVSFQTRLNEAQTSWVVWNQVEDERMETKTRWEQALLVASAFNGKSAKELSNRWNGEDSREKDYRERIKSLAREGKISTADTKAMRAKVETFDDLREEMKRWMAGEEDEHDRIVREHKDYMYAKIEEDRVRAEEASERNRQRLEDLSVLNAGAPIRAFSDEEIARLNLAPKRAKTSSEYEERFDHVKKRYIYAQETSGSLVVDDEGQIVSELPPPKKSLMEQLEGRTPKID